MPRVEVLDDATVEAHGREDSVPWPVVTGRVVLEAAPDGLHPTLVLSVQDAPEDRERGLATRPEYAAQLQALVVATFADQRLSVRWPDGLVRPMKSRDDPRPGTVRWQGVAKASKARRAPRVPRTRDVQPGAFEEGRP